MDFFQQFDAGLQIPSRQGFAKAREKISYLAFKDFFEKSCELVVEHTESKLYKGYRLMAIDGTSFVVGNFDKLCDHFGKSTTVPGKAMCRISAVVDVLDDSIADALVSPFCEGERALAIRHVETMKAVNNALFLFDRGYWSEELVAKIIANEQKFLMRLPSNNKKSSIISTDGDKREIPLRRFSFTLPSGAEETLITNILDNEMSNNELAALYAKRWGIETKYLELKNRLQIDKFSGESVNTVLQDIYSTLYISNLVAFICDSANEIIEDKQAGKSNKYKQKANKSICIATLRRRFISICLAEDNLLQQILLDRLYYDISKSVTYIGKSKARPRNKRDIKNSRTHYNKPLL